VQASIWQTERRAGAVTCPQPRVSAPGLYVPAGSRGCTYGADIAQNYSCSGLGAGDRVPSRTPRTTATPQGSLPNSRPAHEGARSCTFTEMPLVRHREGKMAVLTEHDSFLTIHTVYFVKRKEGVLDSKWHWQGEGGKRLRAKQHRRVPGQKGFNSQRSEGPKCNSPPAPSPRHLPSPARPPLRPALPHTRGLLDHSQPSGHPTPPALRGPMHDAHTSAGSCSDSHDRGSLPRAPEMPRVGRELRAPATAVPMLLTCG